MRLVVVCLLILLVVAGCVGGQLYPAGFVRGGGGLGNPDVCWTDNSPSNPSWCGNPSVADGLRTGGAPDLPEGACYTSGTQGRLEADGHGGTTIVPDGLPAGGPVSWPRGYSARPNGRELDVLDPSGRVVATTGSRWYLPGGPGDGGVWYACGAVPPLS
jgi:hypothetical protein